MDESRKQFEEWLTAEHDYFGSDFEWNDYRNCYEKYGIHLAYKAWQVSRQSQQVVAYLCHHGNSLSPSDFKCGEAEMHETAKREEWAPLVKKGGE